MDIRTAIRVAFGLVWATIWASTASWAGIGAQYPGDVGIENHPDVVFVERFEDSLSTIFARWGDVKNSSNLTLGSDVPAESPGSRSLAISGPNSGGHLYKLLSSTGYNDTLYVRYYIKYPSGSMASHNGIWMGGYNPPIDWPDPGAGTKPQGNDRFSAAAEDRDTHLFDHYNYWMAMHQSNDGAYWGNVLLNNPNVKTKLGQWMCVEQMVKLNNPTTAFNGEHAIWIDEQKVSHLGQGFPRGYWNGGRFYQDPSVSTTFEGFRWRGDLALNLNWIWLQNYTPDSPSVTLKFDHVVVAKRYIGCLASGTPADTTPPAPPSNLTVK